MKDTIKQLTANSKAMAQFGITREPSYDFEDDGNHFKGYMWQGKLPITQLYADGELYLTIRDDYVYPGEIPYDFWKKYPESELGDEYNGTTKQVDLVRFAGTCEVIWNGLQKAIKDFEAIEVDTTTIVNRIKAELAPAEKMLNQNINWFDCNLSERGIKEAYHQFKSLKKSVERDYETIQEIESGVYPKNRLYDLTNGAGDVSHSAYFVRELQELIDQKDYEWYYEVKTDSMK